MAVARAGEGSDRKPGWGVNLSRPLLFVGGHPPPWVVLRCQRPPPPSLPPLLRHCFPATTSRTSERAEACRSSWRTGRTTTKVYHHFESMGVHPRRIPVPTPKPTARALGITRRLCSLRHPSPPHDIVPRRGPVMGLPLPLPWPWQRCRGRRPRPRRGPPLQLLVPLPTPAPHFTPRSPPAPLPPLLPHRVGYRPRVVAWVR